MRLMPQKPDYGIDAPGVVRNLLVIGVVLILSGILFPVIHIGQVTVFWSASASGREDHFCSAVF